jgi:hypothetical protein
MNIFERQGTLALEGFVFLCMSVFARWLRTIQQIRSAGPESRFLLWITSVEIVFVKLFEALFKLTELVLKLKYDTRMEIVESPVDGEGWFARLEGSLKWIS